LVQQEQVTLVIVEHIFNIPRILELATTVWTLADGKLTVESAAKVKHPAAGGFPAPPEASILGWLQEIAGEEEKIDHLQLPGGAMLSLVRGSGLTPGAVMLEVEDLVVYRGKRLVIGAVTEDGQVQGLSFALRQGELAVLQAPNGWGKTTLLEAIAGLIPLTRGIIRLMGRPIQNLPTWERVNLGLSLLQARDNTFPSLTVREVLRLARIQEIPANIHSLLHKQMSDLSGGEKQKVVISCTLKRNSFKIGILDEPLAALDPNAVENVNFLISNLLNGIALLVAIPVGI